MTHTLKNTVLNSWHVDFFLFVCATFKKFGFFFFLLLKFSFF